ncbi:SIR2 family protein [Bradyrhizobium sp.]|uniref:SIR2 family protein n=1 Tax=Bradyrhizobium sp. TaxID=376 RepID=UPI002609F4B9|nr:SIR2 family protein [Bradyrhizobium sp.]
MDGKIVLFAGAGISTEAKGVMPRTLYNEVRHVLKIEDQTRSFPDVMQDFCSTPSGKIGLIQRINDHFDYAYVHTSIFRNATRFHRELATFFPLDTIVTTNWDTYFEDICAATPFIEDRDIAFWEVAKRRVLKIHGSITNFGSIVATTNDYDLCKARLESGLIGAHLKSLLATRSVVFVGYSLQDDDFLQIYGSVRSALKDFHRQAYFVAPEINEQDRLRLREMNLHLIETDGTFFLSQIKAHATTKRCIIPDEMYNDVAELLTEVEEAHSWLHDTYNAKAFPQILYCSWYQDGLSHALERILRLRSTGIYSDLHRTSASARSYDLFAQRYRKLRYYGDSAYCYGYSNAYLYAALTSEERQKYAPGLFFYFDNEIRNARQYARALKRLPEKHKAAFKYAQGVVRRHPYLDSHIMHHMDQLNLSLVADEQDI